MPNPTMQKLRAKYPQYNSYDDKTLAKMIVAKYPQYQNDFSEFLSDNQSPTIEGALRQPSQTLDRAVNYLEKGNVMAGIGAGGQAGLETAMLPFSVADAAVRKIPVLGEPLANAVALPFNLVSQGINAGSGLIEKGLTALGGPESVLSLGMNPEADKEMTGLVKQAGNIALAPLAAKSFPVLAGGVRKAGTALETTASKLAGKAFGTGENFVRTRQLGKFAQEHGLSMSEKSYYEGKKLTRNINNEIQTKIIQPATAAGELIDGSKYISAMEDFKTELENRAVPDAASIFAVKRMIKSANERLQRSQTPGFLTPADAQTLKVTNNKILADVYKKMEAQGAITEKLAAKKVALMEQTDLLRSQLEDVHPELKNLNWHEGAGLEITNAIYDYLNKTARGENSSNVVLRGSPAKATASVYDILKVRPIESRVAIALGKIGRAITGNRPDIVTGVISPYSKPNVPPTSTGTILPPIIPSPTSGTPISPSPQPPIPPPFITPTGGRGAGSGTRTKENFQPPLKKPPAETAQSGDNTYQDRVKVESKHIPLKPKQESKGITLKPTNKSFEEYRKYVKEQQESGKEPLNFSEWKKL